MGKAKGENGIWGTSGSVGSEDIHVRAWSVTVAGLVLDTGLSFPSTRALRMKVLMIQLLTPFHRSAILWLTSPPWHGRNITALIKESFVLQKHCSQHIEEAFCMSKGLLPALLGVSLLNSWSVSAHNIKHQKVKSELTCFHKSML